MTLQASGYGFGTRKMPGISNVTRVMAFSTDTGFKPHADRVTVISFEVDDQTPEDLALGLDRLRAHEAVLDVFQATVVGKQGRQAATIQVLTKPDALEDVSDLCFTETTTIGLRVQMIDRLVLPRRELLAEDESKVKIVSRPNGLSAKTDIKSFQHTAGAADRNAARRRAEDAALNENQE